MKTKGYWLIILVGCSAVLFCSCSKDCGMSYTLTDDAYSGAGYAEIVSVDDGELCFSVSSESDEDINLIVRGRGNATAEIVTNGIPNPISFSDLYLWKEVEATVHLHLGQNDIRIRKIGNAETSIFIDFIEYQ